MVWDRLLPVPEKASNPSKAFLFHCRTKQKTPSQQDLFLHHRRVDLSRQKLVLIMIQDKCERKSNKCDVIRIPFTISNNYLLQAPGENATQRSSAYFWFLLPQCSFTPELSPARSHLTTPQPSHAVLSLQTASGTPKNGGLITINFLLFIFDGS